MRKIIELLKKVKDMLYKYFKKACFFVLFSIASFNKIKRKIKCPKYDNEKVMILIGKIKKGGAERAAINLAEKLSKVHETFIVTYVEDDKYMKNSEEYICNTHHIHLEKMSYIKMIKRIKKIKKENKVTYCISFGTGANFINCLTRVNEKVIISIRNYMSVAETDDVSKMKNKAIKVLSDYIVAVSEEVRKDYIKTYKVKEDKICTIYNYCNKEQIEEFIKNYDIDEQDKKIFENSKVVITVGKLKKQKGQWHLIRAFKNVVEKNKDAKLIILGTGELEEYLKTLVKEMNLENYVYILGHKNKNVYTYMKKSDIFVLPSLFEGMPNVILEAMECGLPIIATDCYGGNREIIEPKYHGETKDVKKCEYGILTPKLDFVYYTAKDELTKEEEYISDAINEMLENKEHMKKYREKSAERVNDFNKESYIEKWEEIL